MRMNWQYLNDRNEELGFGGFLRNFVKNWFATLFGRKCHQSRESLGRRGSIGSSHPKTALRNFPDL